MRIFSKALLTLFVIIWAGSCQWSNSAEKNKNDSDSTKKYFSGEKKMYWKNGKLKATIQYVNGMREGINKNYSSSGKLQSIVPYSKNQIEGESIQYYPSGKVHSKINYRHGAKNGTEIWYYENGELYQVSEYKYGKLHGVQKKYHENGKLMSEAVYKNGMPGLGLKEYKEDGTLMPAPYILVKEKDNTLMTGEYIITYKLSDKSYNPKFYAGSLIDGKYFDKSISPIKTINGEGKSVIKLPKGQFMMHTVNVVAVKKTKYRNFYIIQKSVNIAIENR